MPTRAIQLGKNSNDDVTINNSNGTVGAANTTDKHDADASHSTYIDDLSLDDDSIDSNNDGSESHGLSLEEKTQRNSNMRLSSTLTAREETMTRLQEWRRVPVPGVSKWYPAQKKNIRIFVS